MQLRLVESQIEKAASNRRAELTKEKAQLEQEWAACDAESTARRIDLLSHKKRLKELQQLLLKSPDKPSQDR